MTFPLGSLYHGTKFAVEGISEAMSYEMEQIGVKVKIVEPGGVATDFGGRSFDFQNDEKMPEYQPIIAKLMEGMQRMTNSPESMSTPELVAEVIYTAATDGTNTLRYRAGADAEVLLTNRKEFDDETFMAGIKQQFGL